MKILLDECVPSPLRKLLAGHECHTAQEMGWKSIKNGELLSLAEDRFDLFITADQGLAYEQILAVAVSRFLNSRQTSSVQSKSLPHSYATLSRTCPAQSSVALKFLFETACDFCDRRCKITPAFVRPMNNRKLNGVKKPSVFVARAEWASVVLLKMFGNSSEEQALNVGLKERAREFMQSGDGLYSHV